ncbi:DUF6000 family protein [Nonomuraea cavernae]|uniref:Uncharacterized protein n=1 Tax=Nonomuraea cavernae TaxID=2045107 RepID=A0A917ZGG7_9ACTN|nr:DUF6000 family protein [Nonomuraea cavernae]MCA2189433.1 DUF6000 family protein [Nonomuraea cavernae]GGO82298.1 hypothetical protein GCM10012289_73220 [Nonomuraea cavernae]
MRFPIPPDFELIAVVRRYVSSGRGEVRRYLKLLGGGFMMLPDRDLARFARSLAKDARRITDSDLEMLLDSEWRARLTAAWLIGLDRRTHFRERLGAMLLESELVYSGEGYCFALARFAEDSDAEILTAYLDHYLPRLDCHYDQDDAMGALLHLDERLGTDHAARFLVPGGLWERSTMRKVSPAEKKQVTDELCAFADSCMTGTIKQWLPRRRRFLEERWSHPMYGDDAPDR